MSLQEYFRQTLEDLFLHSKNISQQQYQNILDEHYKGCAKCIGEIQDNDKKVIIEITFDLITLKYAMTIAEGQCFEKIILITYIGKV